MVFWFVFCNSVSDLTIAGFHFRLIHLCFCKIRLFIPRGSDCVAFMHEPIAYCLPARNCAVAQSATSGRRRGGVRRRRLVFSDYVILFRSSYHRWTSCEGMNGEAK